MWDENLFLVSIKIQKGKDQPELAILRRTEGTALAQVCFFKCFQSKSYFCGVLCVVSI